MAFNNCILQFAVVAVVLMGSEGCQSSPKTKQTLLVAPAATSAAAVHHNDQGI